jgi:hypothetical protein
LTKDKNDTINNKLGEEDLELKRFVEKGNKLKWTRIIGGLVIIVSLMLGEILPSCYWPPLRLFI